MTKTEQHLENQRKLRETLAALGDDPDAIADNLRKRSIRGNLYDEKTCPLAVYINTHEDFKTADVCQDHIRAFDKYDNRLCMDCDNALYDFIKRFDEGMYPFLETRQA